MFWSRAFSSAGHEHAHGVAVDADHNILVSGFMSNALMIGAQLINGGHFLVKLDPGGNPLWAKGFGAPADSNHATVAVDGSNNVILGGAYRNSIDFGGGPLLNPGGNTDVYLAKFSPQGGHLWSARFGDAEMQSASALATDGAGNIVLTGYVAGSIDFGGGVLTSAGEIDAFVAKVDPAGHHLWSTRFGDTAYQSGHGIAVDGDGRIVATGYFQGTIDIGDGPLVSAGADDLFVATFCR